MPETITRKSFVGVQPIANFGTGKTGFLISEDQIKNPKIQRLLKRHGQIVLSTNVESQKDLTKTLLTYVHRMASKTAWDPYAEGRRIVEELKRAEGGAVGRQEAANRLEISLAHLYNRIRAKKVVVWTDARGKFQFPIWQFGVNGILPGIEECLRHLGTDYWGHMKFFLTPTDSAGGKTPLDLLRTSEIEAAVEIAKEMGA